MALEREGMTMDIGVNQTGYRWIVEEQRKPGKGYVARLWREGQTTAVAAREGFTTREGAMEWAAQYTGNNRSLLEVLFVGFSVAVALGVFVGFARAIVGGGEIHTTVRLGRDRGTGARARPTPTRSR